MTREEFILKIMSNKRMTESELNKWLGDNDLVIAPCHCGFDNCGGWGIYGVEEVE